MKNKKLIRAGAIVSICVAMLSSALSGTSVSAIGTLEIRKLSVAQAGEPSFEETINWLQEQIVAHGGFSPTTHKTEKTMHHSYNSVSVDACNATLKGKSSYFSEKWWSETTFQMTFSLADLDPSSVRVVHKSDAETGAEYSSVLARTSTGKKYIHDIGEYVWHGLGALAGSDKSEQQNYDYDQLSIPINDADLATRIAKALAHAITLCGGKKSPF